MDSSILQCKSLTKSYGKKIALNNIDLNLDSGKIIGLLGPNGSGKTTLLKLISGLLVPNSGEILVDGLHVGVDTKKIISYLPDKHYLNENTKISDLVSFFSDFYEDFDKVKAFDMFSQLNISVSEKLKNMSKGTKEKIRLILVMSRNAKLYLLDEPIGGVDPVAREYILDTIIKNYNNQSTVLISTHLISEVENILDDVVFIKNGEIILTACVEDIKKERNLSIDEIFKEEFKC